MYLICNFKSKNIFLCGRVTVICTIISISITFPLIMNLLTNMAEDTIPSLSSNKLVFYGWRTIMVASAISIGFLLSEAKAFDACIGLCAAVFMVPIFFMFPVASYCYASKQANNSWAGAIQSMGVPTFTMQMAVLCSSVLFMGFGIYGGVKEFMN